MWRCRRLAQRCGSGGGVGHWRCKGGVRLWRFWWLAVRGGGTVRALLVAGVAVREEERGGVSGWRCGAGRRSWRCRRLAVLGGGW